MKGQPVYKPPFLQINIRRSSNSIGRRLVLPNVGSNPTWRAKSSLTKRTGMLIKNECEHGRLLLRQARSLKGAEAKQRNKRQTRGSFSVCFHLNRVNGEASADKG